MKTLNLFTYDYPSDGNDQFFIEDEIKMLSDTFDDINIIPLKWNFQYKKNHIIKDNIKYDFSLAKNLFGFLNLIRIFINVIFCKLLWLEFLKIKKNFIKKIIIIIKERILAENLFLWLKERNKDLNNNIYYSYWSNNTLLAFYLLKEKKIIKDCFARTLGSDLNGFLPNDDFVAFKELKFKLLNFIIILNEGQATKLIKEKLINQDRIIKCYQGIETQNEITEKKLSKEIHFLSCGRLVHVKNTPQIINFIQHVSKFLNNYEIIYTCIGNGPQYDFIKKFAKFDRVKFNLIRKVPSLCNYLKENNIDFFINLSFSEGMSFAVMEAMSLGIPVICSNIPGNTEIINNKNGYVLKLLNNLEMQKIIEDIKKDLENKTFYDKKVEAVNFVKKRLDRKIVLQQMKNLLVNRLLLN